MSNSLQKKNVSMMVFKTLCILGLTAVGVYAGIAAAQQYPVMSSGVGRIAETITTSYSSLGKLMIATAYIAGIGFAAAAVFKFKQHRDNPTQIPIGTPIALLAVGVILIFLPGIISPVGETMFGEAKVNNAAGGFTGGGAANIPGGTD